MSMWDLVRRPFPLDNLSNFCYDRTVSRFFLKSTLWWGVTVSALASSSCDAIFCPAGRVCRMLKERPKCICRESCPARKRETCGSDGLIYHNHCQLHRTACLQHRHIGVDPTGNTCKKGSGDNEGDLPVYSNWLHCLTSILLLLSF